MDKHYLC